MSSSYQSTTSTCAGRQLCSGRIRFSPVETATPIGWTDCVSLRMHLLHASVSSHAGIRWRELRIYSGGNGSKTLKHDMFPNQFRVPSVIGNRDA